jgi:hypothetical protein
MDPQERLTEALKREGAAFVWTAIIFMLGFIGVFLYFALRGI